MLPSGCCFPSSSQGRRALRLVLKKKLTTLSLLLQCGTKTNLKTNLNKEDVNATLWSTLKMPVGS